MSWTLQNFNNKLIFKAVIAKIYQEIISNSWLLSFDFPKSYKHFFQRKINT